MAETDFERTEIQETNKNFGDFIHFFRDFIILLIIVILMRTLLITPFRINGSSMNDSYHDGEYILIDKFSYLDFANFFQDVTNSTGSTSLEKGVAELIQKIPIHIGDPKRGDVVVVRPHVDISREFYIKRVIGIPGDIIRFENGNVLIEASGSTHFVQIHEPYLNASNSGQTRLSGLVGNQFQIPDGYYWVMWDNRQNSADSRSCFLGGPDSCYGKPVTAHFIERHNIIGKVFLDFGYFRFIGNNWLFWEWSFTWVDAPRFLDTPKSATYPELWD